MSPLSKQSVNVERQSPNPMAVISATVRVVFLRQLHQECITCQNQGKSLGFTFLSQFMIHRNLQIGSAEVVQGVKLLFSPFSLLFSYLKLQNLSLKQCQKPAYFSFGPTSISLKPCLYCWVRFSKYLSIKSKNASFLDWSTRLSFTQSSPNCLRMDETWRQSACQSLVRVRQLCRSTEGICILLILQTNLFINSIILQRYSTHLIKAVILQFGKYVLALHTLDQSYFFKIHQSIGQYT